MGLKEVIMKYFLSFIGLLILTFCLSAQDTGKKEAIKKGDIAPKIVLRDINNKLVLCNNILKQKPVLVNFFFTDCAPCKKEIPELDALNEKYNDRIRMLLIATDKEGADAVKPYADRMNIRMDILIDKYSDIAKAYNVTKYPSVYIIGKDGKVKYAREGYYADNIKKIENIIINLR
jgi:peroxiredoxin